MKLMKLLFVLAAAASLPAHSALACAACYGQSDSPLAAGMNWGIFSLMAVIGCVLGGIATFFIFLAKKAAAAAATVPESEPEALLATPQKA